MRMNVDIKFSERICLNVRTKTRDQLIRGLNIDDKSRLTRRSNYLT